MSAVTSAFRDSEHSPACSGCPLRADFCLRIRSSAWRTERHRTRRRQATRAISSSAMMTWRHLPEEASRDPTAIKAAVEGVVADLVFELEAERSIRNQLRKRVTDRRRDARRTCVLDLTEARTRPPEARRDWRSPLIAGSYQAIAPPPGCRYSAVKSAVRRGRRVNVRAKRPVLLSEELCYCFTRLDP